jgi:hypothetical protein
LLLVVMCGRSSIALKGYYCAGVASQQEVQQGQAEATLTSTQVTEVTSGYILQRKVGLHPQWRSQSIC